MLARDLDAIPFRADTRMNAMVRAAAAGQGGVTFVDAEQALMDDTQGLPGAGLFYEHVHFRFHGNYVLARALFPAVADAVGARLGRTPCAPAALPAEEACAFRLAYTRWDELKLQRAMVRLFTQHAFDGQLGRLENLAGATAVLKRMEDAFTAAERRQACERYGTAIKRAPRDWFLRHNVAELLMELGHQRGAASQWQWLVARYPRHEAFRLYLAISLINAGDHVGAQQQLQTILCDAPDDAGALRLLALATTP